MKFTFKLLAGPNSKRSVFLDGKRVGTIRKDDEGFRYFPKDSIAHGEAFATLALCKASLGEAA